MTTPPNRGKLALLVGGGPAPGINGVISSVTIEAINHGMEVVGFVDGFKWLVQGNTEHVKPLTIELAKPIHRRGGSILGTSRTNPTKSDADMRNVLDVLRRLEVGYLVTIGGDDTAYSASRVYAEAGGAIRVAHVPKTIHIDLPVPGSTLSVSFKTARQPGLVDDQSRAQNARAPRRW